ncbi:PAS domain-containing protein, partial [Halorubrum lacusprofundi]|uniref:PAS domain-containing protein n=1 Tax=Halorubrum lacusprofundi TaxID=2247 RepID=UPI00117A04BA
MTQSTNFADAVPHLLFRAAPDGRFEFLNRRFAELTGHDPVKGGVEQGWLNALTPDDSARLRDDFTAVSADGTDVRSKISLRHADGTFRWMLLVARRPDVSDGGHAASWYGGASDIDAEMMAEAEVRDLNATLQERIERQTAELSRTETRYASLFAVSKIAFA